MKTVKYISGELTLNDNGSLTAIGEEAHQALYRLWMLEKRGLSITKALFQGLVEAKIIV